jgi:hypothetical protein
MLTCCVVDPVSFPQIRKPSFVSQKLRLGATRSCGTRTAVCYFLVIKVLLLNVTSGPFHAGCKLTYHLNGKGWR